MSERLITVRSIWSEVGAGQMDYVNCYGNGNEIVSIGVQTKDNQDSFWVAQAFVMFPSTQAYAQVFNNNKIFPVEWAAWVTLLPHSADNLDREVRFEFKSRE